MLDLAIVLVRPQLAQNVGMVARAMANCGAADLRLVAPSFDWHAPQTRATAESSAGRNSKIAHQVLVQAQVFADLPSAIADLQRVWATSARVRDVAVPQMELQEAMAALVAAQEAGQGTGILFGPERTGLENDELVCAEARVFVPLVEGAVSLNLAQAVLLTCWELLRARRALEGVSEGATAQGAQGAQGAKAQGAQAQGAKAQGAQTQGAQAQGATNPPAERAVLDGFLSRLEDELIAAEYYPPTETAETMRRNLRAFFARSQATAQEIQSLEGMIRALAARRAVRARKSD